MLPNQFLSNTTSKNYFGAMHLSPLFYHVGGCRCWTWDALGRDSLECSLVSKGSLLEQFEWHS